MRAHDQLELETVTIPEAELPIGIASDQAPAPWGPAEGRDGVLILGPEVGSLISVVDNGRVRDEGTARRIAEEPVGGGRSWKKETPSVHGQGIDTMFERRLVRRVIGGPPAGGPKDPTLHVYNRRSVVITSLPLHLSCIITIVINAHGVVSILWPMVTSMERISFAALAVLVPIVLHILEWSGEAPGESGGSAIDGFVCTFDV